MKWWNPINLYIIEYYYYDCKSHFLGYVVFLVDKWNVYIRWEINSNSITSPSENNQNKQCTNLIIILNTHVIIIWLLLVKLCKEIQLLINYFDVDKVRRWNET